VKKVLWGGVALIVLLVAAVLIGPGLINWNDYKSEITKQVKNFTGRDLEIKGDIRITVLPSPAVVVHDVSISNMEGASAARMVSLKSAEVRIALAPLLGGQVKIQTVKLVEPVIALEVLPDGRQNWVFEAPEAAASPSENASSGGQSSASLNGSDAGPAFILDNFTIERGTLLYSDLTTGVNERVDAINAQIAAASLKGPFEIRGTMTARKIPLTYDLNIGAVIQDRTVPINVNVGVAPDQASFQIVGILLGLTDDPRFKGNIKGGGNNLATLITAVSGERAPELLAQTFGIEAEISGSAAGGEVKDLLLSIADSKATGDIAVEIAAKTDFAIRLSATRFDIDKWLAAANTNAAQVSKSSTASKPAKKAKVASTKVELPPAVSEPAKLIIPADLNGSIILSVDTVEYRDGIIRDFAINADVANSQVTLSQMSAQFPGGSDIAVFGTVSAPGGEPNFVGEVETTVNDLRGVLTWLGTDLAGVPSDRLRKLSLKSAVNATPKQVQVTGLDLRFDSSRLTGAATVALRKRPSLGVSVALDRINVDAYLPKSLPKKTNQAEPAPTTAKTTKSKPAQPKENPQSPFESLGVLGAFDANLKAQVKSLVYHGEQIRDARIDGTLYNGNLELRRLSVGRFAGATANVTGKLNNLTGLPSASGLRIKSSSKNLGPLMKFIGADTGLDMKKLGAFSMDSLVDGNLLKPKIKSLIKIAGASVNAVGNLSVLPISDMFDFKISAKHTDAARLIRAFGTTYRPSGKIGGLDVSFRAKGNPKSISLDGLQGRIGAATLGGNAALDLKGAKPKLTANLKTGALTVDPFLPATKKAGLDDLNWGGVQVIPVAWPGSAIRGKNPTFQLAAMRGRWNADPIDLSMLKEFDADISLQSPVIIIGKYLVEKADVSAVIKDGVLNTRRFAGNLFGGALAINTRVSAGPSNQIDSVIKVTGIRIEKALRAVIGEAAAEGKLGVDLSLQTSGRSIADFVSALAGNGTFAMNDVDVSKKTEGSVFSGIYGLVSALNQFGVSKKGERADVSGSFKMAKGVAVSNDLTLASGIGNGTAAGTVDLPNWNLQVDGQIELVQSALTQLLQAKIRETANAVPFSISGPLDAPKVDVDMGAALGSKVPIPGANLLLNKAPKGIGGLLKGILGGGTTTQQQPSSGTTSQTGDTPPPPRSTQSQPQQQQKTIINPQDLLKQLFK